MTNTSCPFPSISLVIPAYNEEAYLPACLDAVFRNVASKVLEIIVVDNRSTDGTRAIAVAREGVTYVYEAEKGITRARQRGFEAARGEVIAFVDADTRPPAGWIDEIEQAFSFNEDLACLSGPYSFYDLAGASAAVSRWWFKVARPLGVVTGHLMVGGNFAIRRDVLSKMGGFDRSIEFYGEDVDVGRRAKRHGKVHFSPALVMPTSARRMRQEGFGRIAGTYLANYVSIALGGRPCTENYNDVR